MNVMKLAVGIVEQKKEELWKEYHEVCEREIFFKENGSEESETLAKESKQRTLTKITCCSDIIEQLEQAMKYVEIMEEMEKKENE